MSVFRKVMNQLFPGFKRRAIPSLDGPLRPNSYLDECPEIGGEIPAPDDVATDGDTSVFISTGSRILSLSGEGYSERNTVAEFDSLVTGLTSLPDGGLCAGVAGRGVCFVGGSRDGETVTSADGEPISCPLSIAAADDGTLYVTEGSTRNSPDRWVLDLMDKGATGRLIRIDAGEKSGVIMLDELQWPYGVAMTRDGGSLLLTESWRHGLIRLSLGNNSELRREEILDNLPGYPARIVSAPDGGYWLCLFALRTHLIDFVLKEDGFRTEMIKTIDPAFWIAPALKRTDHILEPLQQAGIKHWGIRKPWAPPRSYGLIMRLDPELRPVTSYHSRADEIRHGITGLAAIEAGVLAASKGGDRILILRNGDVQ